MPRQFASFCVLVTGLSVLASADWEPSRLSGSTPSSVSAPIDWDKSVSEPPKNLTMPSPTPTTWPAATKTPIDPNPLPVSPKKAPVEAELLGGPSEAPAAFETNIIYGNDERKQLDGTLWPYRAIVRIEALETCSGWMANANTIITAAHCLSASSAGVHKWANLAAIKIHPGVTFNGVCQAVRLYVTDGWRAGRGRAFDYGAIKLNCNLGDTTGWFGFGPVKPAAGDLLRSFVGYDLQGDVQNGSTCDPCGMQGRVRGVSGRLAFHELDTTPGMSGAPIYSGSQVRAIHATGKDAKGASGNLKLGSDYNSGPFIDARIYKNLIAWTRAPAK